MLLDKLISGRRSTPDGALPLTPIPMPQRSVHTLTLKFALAAGLLEAMLQLILVAAALSFGREDAGWPEGAWLWGSVLLPAVRSGGLLALATGWWVWAWAESAAAPPPRTWRLLLVYLALAQLFTRAAGLFWTRCVSWPIAQALQGDGVPPANIDLYIGPVNAVAQAALMLGFSLLAWRLALRLCAPHTVQIEPAPALSAPKAALLFTVYMLLLHLLAGQFVLQMLSLGTMALAGQAAAAFALASLLVSAIVYVAARRRLRQTLGAPGAMGPAAARAFFTLYGFWLVLLMLLQIAAWLAAAPSEAMLAPLLALAAIYLVAAYPITSRTLARISPPVPTYQPPGRN